MSSSNLKYEIKCEWCKKLIKDKIHYYQNHPFCSIDCKYEALDHYDVEDQRRDDLRLKSNDEDDYYKYDKYYRD